MSYLTNGYGNNTAQIGRQAHPDVLTNIIAQRIIALGMSKDPSFRGDINSTLGNRFILVTGQASSSNLPTESEIISEVLGAIESAGYTRNGTYNPLERQVLVDIDGQSPNISNSVGNGGAGDTVVKHGFATNTTKEFLPLPHILAKEIAKRLSARQKVLVDLFSDVMGLDPEYSEKIACNIEHVLDDRLKSRISAFNAFLKKDSIQSNILKRFKEEYESI